MQKKRRAETKEQMCNFEIFWIIIFEGKQNEKLKELAMDSLCKLAETYQEIKEEYINRIGTIFQSTPKSSSIPRCLQILIKMDFIGFKTIKKTGYYDDTQELEEYIQQNSLVQIVLGSCLDCHVKIAKKLKDEPNLKKSIMTLEVEAGDEMVFGKQAKLYLDFLQEVTTASKKLPLEKGMLEMIWNYYNIEQFSIEHCNCLWEILQKEKKGDILGFFTNKSDATEFFTAYFANRKNFEIKNITLPALRCFKKYFDYLNDKKDHYGRQVIITVDKMQGIDTLWNITLETSGCEVQKTATDYLVGVYYKTLTENPDSRMSVVQHFVTQVLTKQYPDASKFHLSISVLNAFISRYFRF